MTLTSGTVNSYGIFGDGSAGPGNISFDTFQVTATTAIPEPATRPVGWAWGVIGLAFMRRARLNKLNDQKAILGEV